MATQLGMCNKALAMLGHPPMTAGELAAGTPGAAVWCSQLYTPARDALLREAPWPELLTRGALDGALDAQLSGWLYRYSLPAGFIRLWGLAPTSEALQVDSWSLAYRIEGGGILSNDSELWALYTSTFPDDSFEQEAGDPEVMFGPLLEDALVARIAAAIALPLTGDMNKTQMMMGFAGQAAARAKNEAAAADKSVHLQANIWRDARRGYYAG